MAFPKKNRITALGHKIINAVPDPHAKWVIIFIAHRKCVYFIVVREWNLKK